MALKNGTLLSLMMTEGFTVFITFDKNLQYQQNFEKYPITVIVLTANSNQYKHIQPLIPAIHTLLTTAPLKQG